MLSLVEVAEPLTDAVVCQPVVEGPAAVASGGSAGSSAAPSILPSSPLAAPLQTRYGLDVPATPQQAADQTGPGSSRNSPTTRAHAVETEGSEPKRFKSEEHKKQRINSLTEEREAMIRTVQLALKAIILWTPMMLNSRRMMLQMEMMFGLGGMRSI